MRILLFFLLSIILVSCTTSTSEPEDEFDCLIRYLDAVFMEKNDYCESQPPMKILTGEDTLYYPRNDMRHGIAIYKLDSMSGRKSNFTLDYSIMGASISNYSDSLYLEERKAWIEHYEERGVR